MEIIIPTKPTHATGAILGAQIIRVLLAPAVLIQVALIVTIKEKLSGI